MIHTLNIREKNEIIESIKRRPELEKAILKNIIHSDRYPDHEPSYIEANQSYVTMIYKHEIKANIIEWMIKEGFTVNNIRTHSSEEILITFKCPIFIQDIFLKR